MYSTSAISTGDRRVKVNLSFVLGPRWNTDGRDRTEIRESEPQIIELGRGTPTVSSDRRQGLFLKGGSGRDAKKNKK